MSLEKLKIYLVARRKQILRMCNDRMSYCSKNQLNFQEDPQFIRLGLELHVLRTVQRVSGITDEELTPLINQTLNESNKTNN